MAETNFDRHLAKQLKDSEFSERFEKAREAWDIAIQLTRLREAAGLSQSALARKLKTSQQQISRLGSPSYEGHSLSMLRRIAQALDARLTVSLEPAKAAHVQEAPDRYKTKAKQAARKFTKSAAAPVSTKTNETSID